jgi:hypothetical protein
MKIHAQQLPLAHDTLLGPARFLVRRLIDAVAARRALRRENALQHRLSEMDSRLLDDIGMASPTKPLPLEGLTQMNPAVLAATVLSQARDRH